MHVLAVYVDRVEIVYSSIGKHCKDREYKTVMYNAADRRVWIAIYVWKKTSDDSNEEQELISLADLAHIQTCIHLGIENPDYQCTYGEGQHVVSTSNEANKASSSGDGGKSADSKLGLQVKTVQIQVCQTPLPFQFYFFFSSLHFKLSHLGL